ncbi:MAG: hypothetical protein GF315_00375, partial [candidate division Zixibacteria bacterium]|nr:hypothetical protein [candidate division Zixibacteria bacterium]
MYGYALRIIIAGMIFCLLAEIGFSQDTLWTRRYSGTDYEKARDFLVTEDGGYVLAGNRGLYGAYILRADSLGDSLWSITLGSQPHHNIEAICHRTDAEGYMATGYIDPGPYGNSDFWLVAISEEGDTLWSRTYGGGAKDRARAMAATNDGGYILTGFTYSFGIGGADWWIVKVDSNGDIQWRRTYGWTDYDVANSIEQTADGGYIVAGYSYLYEWERAYIAKTDPDGDTVWFSVELHQPYKYFTCAKQTIDGGYIVLGLEATGDRQYHDGFHLLKYSPTGNKLWTRRFGALPRRNNAYDLLQTPDGGFIAVGYGFGGVQYRAGLVRTDLQGNLLWGRLYPTGTESSELHAIEQTAPNEYAAAGRAGGDFWLMKLWEPAYCCEVEMITDDEP